MFEHPPTTSQREYMQTALDEQRGYLSRWHLLPAASRPMILWNMLPWDDKFGDYIDAIQGPHTTLRRH